MPNEDTWQTRQTPVPFPLNPTYSSTLLNQNNDDSQVYPHPFDSYPDSLTKLFAEEARTQASISLCLHLQRLLDQEVSKRITQSNIISDLRFKLQETGTSLNACEVTVREKDQQLIEAQKEIERLTSIVADAMIFNRRKVSDTVCFGSLEVYHAYLF